MPHWSIRPGFFVLVMSANRPVPIYVSNVPNFSDISWNANSLFKYSEFGVLHDAAGNSLHGIFPNSEGYKGIKLNPNNLLDFDDSSFDFEEIVSSNAPVFVYSGIALLLTIVLIVTGIIWFIGRLCCTCNWLKKKATNNVEYVQNRFGGARQNSDLKKQKSPKKKRSIVLQLGFGITLICLAVVYMYFLIGLFVTNSQLRSSIGQLPTEIDEYLEDGVTYIDVTKRQIDAVLKISYGNLSEEVRIIGNCAPTERTNSLKIEIALSQLLHNVTDNFRLLKSNDVTPILKPLEMRNEALEIFLKNKKSSPRDVCQDVETLRLELETNANEMNAALDAIPIEGTRNDLEDIEQEFVYAESAIFYSVTVLNLMLVVILITIALGTILLLIKPIRKIGSIVLNCSIFAIFALGWLIWLFSIGIFFLSGILVVVVPGVFDNIATNGSLVNPDAVLKQDAYVMPSVPHILQTCKNSEAAYTVFKLDQVYNVTDLQKLIDILVPATPLVGQKLNQSAFDPEELEKELLGINGNVTANQIRDVIKLMTELDSTMNLYMTQEEALRTQVTAYVEFAQLQLETNIGNCGPLYRVLESTLHTFSYKMGIPIGAYWFAITIILLLLFPIVLTSIIFLRQ